MSYILNALRKSEQERNALKPETPLPNMNSHKTQAPRRKFFRLIPLILLINIAALSYLVYRLPSSHIADPNPQPVTPIVATETLTKPSDTVELKNAQPSPVKIVNDTTSISELVNSTQKPKIETSDTQTTENKTNIPPNRDTEPAILTNTKPSSTQPETEVPIEATVAVKKAAGELIKDNAPPPPLSTEPKLTSENSHIPWLNEFGSDFQAKIPPLTINVLAFDQNPSARFAIIDMTKYKAGQRIKDSLILKDILADSLVLSFEGQEFRVGGP